MSEPTHCDRCQGILECSHVSIYRGETLIRTICDGCHKIEQRQEYEETGVITTRFMTDVCIDAAMARRHSAPVPRDEAKVSIDHIQRRVSVFEQRVWFGGLREHLEGHSQRGESLQRDDLKMLTFVMAGRVMITIEDKQASLTVITTDENNNRPKMGIQGICATETQAFDLLDRAERAWLAGHRTIPDREVRIAGM